jgi:CrcB protein
MNIQKLFLVGIGGFAGSVFRYAMARFIDERASRIMPFGTLTVNIIGCFIIGVIYGLLLRKLDLSENIRLLFGVGFCGGFTTFSAFAFENLTFIQQKNFGSVLMYSVASVVLGILAVWGGFSIVKNG